MNRRNRGGGFLQDFYDSLHLRSPTTLRNTSSCLAQNFYHHNVVEENHHHKVFLENVHTRGDNSVVGSRYAEINKRCERFVNKYKTFPDYSDIFDIVVGTNRKFQLRLG